MCVCTHIAKSIQTMTVCSWYSHLPLGFLASNMVRPCFSPCSLHSLTHKPPFSCITLLLNPLCALTLFLSLVTRTVAVLVWTSRQLQMVSCHCLSGAGWHCSPRLSACLISQTSLIPRG